MWRREQGLEFWLKGAKSDSKLKRSFSGKTKLAEKFGMRPFKCGVSECPLEIHSGTIISAGTVISQPLDVVDGMDFIGTGQESQRSDQTTLESWNTPGTVRPLPLIRTPRIGSAGFPDSKSVRIRQFLMSIAPYCRRLQVNMEPVSVQNIKLVQFSPPAMGKIDGLIIGVPGVHAQTSQISGMSLHQPCTELRTLSEGEIHAYRSEAAGCRGIAENDCELIAIFRHVPIEMISKLRFLDSTKELVYTLIEGMSRTRTRIYDLMVVRDESKKEVHLVPHRTRNKMVCLN